MKCYCWECAKENEYTTKQAEEKMTIKGYTFTVMQEHAYCAICGADLYPDEVEDGNTERANDAYREACGSITVKDIRRLLEKYQIGANPMSKLLGWGENTIDRQMRHTVPTRACADKLRSLFDPYEMQKLLHKNGNAISGVAYKKAEEAVNRCIGESVASIAEDTMMYIAFFKTSPFKSVLEISDRAKGLSMEPFVQTKEYLVSDVAIGDCSATIA